MNVMTILRRVFVCVCLCAMASAASAATELVPLEYPRSLKVDANLRSSLEQMRAASATFTAQCARLDAEDKLVVLLRLDPTLSKVRFRARSTIKRYSSGLLVATVSVAPGSDQAEWIAHEFEHVLEVLDGGYPASDLRAQSHGLTRSADGMIETARAVAVGRTVLHETKTIDVSDKFVE